MRLLVVTAFGALLATALALACSTSDDGGGSPVIVACRETFTMCPLDPVASLAQTQECTTALDGPCGNAGLVYRTCVTGACTDAGFTDYGGIAQRCYNAQVSFQDCLDALDASVASTTGGDDDIGDDEDAAPRPNPAPTATATGTTSPPPVQDAAAPVDAGAIVDAMSPPDADAGADGSLL